LAATNASTTVTSSSPDTVLHYLQETLCHW